MSGISTRWGWFLDVGICGVFFFFANCANAQTKPLVGPLYTPLIDPLNPTQNFDHRCTPGSKFTASSFVITGRGGLPPNPKDILTPDAIQVDWVTLNPNIDNRKSPSVSTPTKPTPEPIVEATGWVFNAKGEVVFTASARTTTPRSSWQKSVECRN